MAKDSSPSESVDSALESISTNGGEIGFETRFSLGHHNYCANQVHDNINDSFRQPETTDDLDLSHVHASDLEKAAREMRSNNVSLISRSIRTVLSCFDDLDIQRFEPRTEYLVNFISNGINDASSTILRPVSILWPDSYERMVKQLSFLDAFLLNTQFREKPIDWMLKRGLTMVPECRLCKNKMELKSQDKAVRWQCQRSQACSNYSMPVQRPSFFSTYEKVGLDKLLFSIYYWSTCTPAEELYSQMNLNPEILVSLWRRMQNVCRAALDKSYPRHRLTNVIDTNNPNQANSQIESEPIDLVSIKLNEIFIVCAKHPKSNLVRLGFYIPNVSTYSFVDLTESWFAHGTYVRVSEEKFSGLAQRRTDIKLQVVSRLEMVSKDGQFDRDSAFGYIVSQLTHVLKDFDSATLSCENLKLVLAEIQWRELFGTNPFDAFTNIVNHMAQFGQASNYFTEPGQLQDKNWGDISGDNMDNPDYIWAEKYFYAAVEPVDSTGKLIRHFNEPPDPEAPPQPDVRIQCHFCSLRFECFEFSIHLIKHVEINRKEGDNLELKQRNLIECKHCFKTYKRQHVANHSTIFRAQRNALIYSCRICCVALENRKQFIQHMRTMHFEQETPYRCPSCPYATSFQQDVFIHFQEEHRHSMIILCPLCLRSFTVAKPEEMTKNKMEMLSRTVYKHLCEHYIQSKGFTCTNCCLCFLDREALQKHRKLHHDPLEIRPSKGVKVEQFIVTKKEEMFCVRALRAELFIANKRPNLTLDTVVIESSAAKPPPTRDDYSDAAKSKRRGRPKKNLTQAEAQPGSSCSGFSYLPQPSTSGLREIRTNSINDVTPSCSFDPLLRDDLAQTNSSALSHERISLNPAVVSDSDENSRNSTNVAPESDEEDDGTIHVRGLKGDVCKFLHGGRPAMRIANRASAKNDQLESCSSQKLIDYLSKMKRADGIIPNQSVLLTPIGRPARCSECAEHITVDHFVALIVCKKCNYTTHCPRASTLHNKRRHVIENSSSTAD